MLLAVAFSIQAAENPVVEIIAHRGASHDAPENTIPALKLGFEQQCDAGELDVWISKEGRAVVIHDDTTGRTGDLPKLVAEQTLAELQQLDVGSWKDAKFKGTRIPTLEEALHTTPAGKRMFVEIKCGVAGVPEVLRAIAASGLKPEQTPVISFKADVIAAVKKARPDLKAYWIVSLANKTGRPAPRAADLIAKAKEIQADGLDLSDAPVLDAPFAQQVKDANLALYVWTVDSATAAQRLVKLGVHGITTNRPGWLREKLQLPINDK
jgi:glycerophosphoryl diester phosphodiesterase